MLGQCGTETSTCVEDSSLQNVKKVHSVSNHLSPSWRALQTTIVSVCSVLKLITCVHICGLLHVVRPDKASWSPCAAGLGYGLPQATV